MRIRHLSGVILPVLLAVTLSTSPLTSAAATASATTKVRVALAIKSYADEVWDEKTSKKLFLRMFHDEFPSVQPVEDIFSEKFIRNGRLWEVLKGDYRPLLDLGVFRRVDYVLAGGMRLWYRRSPVIMDLIDCFIVFSYRLIGPGGTVDKGYFAVAGPHFTEEDAMERAVEMVVYFCNKKFGDKLHAACSVSR